MNYAVESDEFLDNLSNHLEEEYSRLRLEILDAQRKLVDIALDLDEIQAEQLRREAETKQKSLVRLKNNA